MCKAQPNRLTFSISLRAFLSLSTALRSSSIFHFLKAQRYLQRTRGSSSLVSTTSFHFFPSSISLAISWTIFMMSTLASMRSVSSSPMSSNTLSLMPAIM